MGANISRQEYESITKMVNLAITNMVSTQTQSVRQSATNIQSATIEIDGTIECPAGFNVKQTQSVVATAVHQLGGQTDQKSVTDTSGKIANDIMNSVAQSNKGIPLFQVNDNTQITKVTNDLQNIVKDSIVTSINQTVSYNMDNQQVLVVRIGEKAYIKSGGDCTISQDNVVNQLVNLTMSNLVSQTTEKKLASNIDTKSANKADQTNVGLLGGIFGGIIGFLIIVVVIYAVIRMKKNKRARAAAGLSSSSSS